MRPHRLVTFDYCGRHRYFVTCCCWQRAVHFANPDMVGLLDPLLMSTLVERSFACLARVFMPDHLHLLLEGTAEESELRSAMKLARQRTGVVFRRIAGKPLWQDGYYERVLRGDEATQDVIAYILNNPVRAGLVADWNQYEFSWSIDIGGRRT
jgi:putative transposase